MRKAVLTIGIWILALLFVLSGDQGRTFAQTDSDERQLSRRFDEYGDLRECDHKARLDNFAIQLQNEPNATAYVIVYGPHAWSNGISHAITDYLVDSRGIVRERIKWAHAGYHTKLAEPRIQLWIVPRGADAPKPVRHDVNVATFKGMVAESKELDVVYLTAYWDESEKDMERIAALGNVTFAAIDEILKAQKGAVAHVVGFNGKDAVPGAWRRVSEFTVESLTRLGHDANRFKIGYGGQVKETKLQIWILPKGEAPPVKNPASEPPPEKAVQVGDFGGFELGHPSNELTAFNRLVALMRENPELRACLIVRIEAPDPVEEIVAELATPIEPPDPEEREPADLPKLVQKWKEELAAKHKIRDDRLIVLFANAHEYRASSLEVWVVPPGRPLPDLKPPADEEQP